MHGRARVCRAFEALGAATGAGRVWARLRGQMGDTLVSTFDQAAVSGFSFLTGIIVARTVDVGSFGRFALVMIAVALAQGVHNALITAPMMTIVGRRHGQARSYFASLLVYAVLLSLGGGVLVAAFVQGLFGLRGEAAQIEFVAAAGCVAAAQNMQFTLRRLLFASASGAGALRMDLFRAALFALAAAAWRYARGTTTVDELLWILAATAAATSLPALRHHLRAAGRGLHLGTVTRRHVPLSRWLLPVVVVTFGQEQAVWIIAGVTLGDAAMGGLRASQYLVGLVLLFLSSTENIIPVAAARALTGAGERGLHRYLVSAAAALGFPVAVVTSAMAVAAPVLLRLVFGPAYVPYAGCLRVLACTVLLVLMRDLVAHRFRAMERTGVIFGAFAFSFAVSLALAYPLLTRLGLAGAALLILFGHAASLAYLAYHVAAERRSRGRAHPASASRPLAAGRE